MSSEAIRILYRDAALVAVDKPCGIMIHNTRISQDTVFLADRLREQIGQRVWPVHRLDRATSGVVLFALSARTARDLGRLFRDGEVHKRYLALLRGWVEDEAVIELPLRDPSGRRTERSARTRYRCLGRVELPEAVPPHPTARYSVVEACPDTGRWHQIRRHFNHLSHPVVGDVQHGDRRHNRLFRLRFGCHRLLLHASRIRFRHPEDQRWLEITSPLPEDFRRVLAALGLPPDPG